jgi:hypothetical protein
VFILFLIFHFEELPQHLLSRGLEEREKETEEEQRRRNM